MDWSNETILEFIELLHDEPVLWTARSKNLIVNRKTHRDAWVRIKNAFSADVTIEDLKKKKNSLLTQYRDYLRKIKESMKTGSEADIYRPSWFAFDLMNSFLGDLYDCPTVFKTNDQDPNFEVYIFPETNVNESNSSNNESSSKASTSVVRKRPCIKDPIQTSKREREETYTEKRVKERSEKEDKLDNQTANECDMFGQLLAQKLKKLKEDDRLKLMNDIDNLTYKCIISVKSRKQLQISTQTGEW